MTEYPGESADPGDVAAVEEAEASRGPAGIEEGDAVPLSQPRFWPLQESRPAFLWLSGELPQGCWIVSGGTSTAPRSPSAQVGLLQSSHAVPLGWAGYAGLLAEPSAR